MCLDPVRAQGCPVLARILSAVPPESVEIRPGEDGELRVESRRTRDPEQLALPTGTVIFLLAEAEGGPSLPRAALDDYQKLVGSALCEKPGVRVRLRERETVAGS